MRQVLGKWVLEIEIYERDEGSLATSAVQEICLGSFFWEWRLLQVSSAVG